MRRPQPGAAARVGVLAVLARWVVSRPPFARITSLAALLIAVSSVLDGVSDSSTRLGPVWIWGWAAVAVVVAVVPLLLGRRCPRWVGLAAAVVFLAVTAVQVATSSGAVETVTDVVLHPMVACYLGWFYRRRTAWTTLLLAVVGTTVALALDPQPGLVTIWADVVVVSAFCLVATGYLHRGLARQATTDPLTGALNRAGFATQGGRALESAARTGRPLALVLLDLDDVKLVNDRHGHARGDRVLVDLVAAVRATVRPDDVVARLGGDEFAVLLRGTTVVQAYRCVADLQDASTVAWSHGVALSVPGDTLETVLERADAALYEVKRQHRSARDRRDVPDPDVGAPLPPGRPT